MSKVVGVGGMLLFAAMMMAQSATPPAATGGSAASQKGEAERSPEDGAIRAVLEAQVAAWNRGDLKGYMQGYWHSAELTFFAGSNESAGWDAAYQRYRSAYAGKDKELGKLKFSAIRVEMLGPEAAFVRGSWQLTTKNGGQRNGLFTVIFKKFGNGWKIIHDHSS